MKQALEKRNKSERGQVLVIIALAMIGLIAITGLAIDGSMVLADRRHAQNAADTAALAGALARVKPQTDGGGNIIPWQTIARDRAGSNGYTGDLLRSQVEVYSCDEVDADCAAPYTGSEDHVKVVILSHVPTTFAQVIGIQQLHNRVEAVSMADDDDTGPLFDGRAIISLNPNCPENGSMVMGGNAKVTINGGGLWANADETCSFACTSSSVDIDITGGGLSSPAPSFDKFGSKCQSNISPAPIYYHTDQILYPPVSPDLPVPDECDSSDSNNYNASSLTTVIDPESGKDVEASLIQPGYYGKFPPAKDQITGKNLKANISMAPGIYCVQEIDQTTGILVGDDVTIYVRPENGVKITGKYTQLRATQSGSFAGYLIVVATDFPASKPASCTINGNSHNIFQGSIFAPHCDITINGDSKTPDAGIDAQIIGYNVTINGGAGLTINYDPNENPVVIDPPKIGITD